MSLALRDGIAAHEALARFKPGQPAVGMNLSTRQMRFYIRLDKMRQAYKLIGEPEQYQRVEWRGWLIRRKLDQPALIGQTRTLLDYKTGTWAWKTGKDGVEWGLAPQAFSYQGTIYTIPPSDPADLGPFKSVDEWPEHVDYLIAPEKSAVQNERYSVTDEDQHQLYDAIENMAEQVQKKVFPKIPGYACTYCDFLQACYRTPGWEELYTRRKEKDVLAMESVNGS